MRTLDLGSYNPKQVSEVQQRGFTLLELLVVLVVIAIATGTIVIQGVPDDSRYLNAQAQKLSQILRIGQQQAALTSQDIRFSTSSAGFQFETYNGRNWVPVEGESQLRERPWDLEGLRTELEQAGQPVEFLTFEPQADLTRREVVLRLNTTEMRVTSANGGQFVISKPIKLVAQR